MGLPKKMGRPTDSPKTHREAFRLSDEDIRKLYYCTQKTGMTKTCVLRKGIDKVYRELKEKDS